MASDIFQPSKSSATRTTTPSAASQEMARFKAGILGQLLDAAARPRPSFADFASRGAQLPASVPGGLSGGIAGLLAAMSQPNAFDTKVTETGKPSAPSLFSDLSQLGILGALLYQSGALGAGYDLGKSGIGAILSHIGGAKGINGINPALGDVVSNAYGDNADMIPGGVAGGVPDTYPGLLDRSIPGGESLDADTVAGLLSALGYA